MSSAAPWSRGSIRSHVGAATQALHGHRRAILLAAEEGDAKALASAIDRLSAHLTAETAWLRDLEPVPDDMQRSQRAVYLQTYGRQVVRLAESLTAALTVKPMTEESFDSVGEGMLVLLAQGKQVGRIQ